MFTTKFQPFVKMIERIENSKQESDSAYYHDLMYLGEMLTKTVASAIISGISNDLDRNKYRLLHKIVRTDGIGEWSSVLDEALTGVPSQFLQSTVRDHEQRELIQKVEKGEWQFDSVEHLLEVFEILDLKYDKIPTKISGKTWFSRFSQLRNKKAHGALLPSICGEASKPLEKSLKMVIENFHLFKREWVYLYQNMSGKYRTCLQFVGKSFLLG